MITPVEKRLRHKRRRSGILVPLLEDYMAKRPMRVETPADIDFMIDLYERSIARELERDKNGKVYSPSTFAACIRRVYLGRHYKTFGITKLLDPRAEVNSYFTKGDFVHHQWQLACFKLDQKLPDTHFKLLGYEEKITSPEGDHGGTSDVRVAIDGTPYIVDVKGVNVRTFSDTANGNPPLQYCIQLADYLYLWNQTHKKKITQGILLTENKGGPDRNHPIALHETIIDLEDYEPEIELRLEILREHETDEEVPEPECTSTGTFQFQSCPFRKFCRKEVEAIARQRKAEEEADFEYRVATPPRNRKRSTRRRN